MEDLIRSQSKGVFVPTAISFALLLLPAVISAQVFGVLEVYEFDDSVEVAGIVFGILCLNHMLLVSLKQSFTVGESYIVAALTISAFYASIFYSDQVESDYTSIFISIGSAAACATGFMLYTGEIDARFSNVTFAQYDFAINVPRLTQGVYRKADY